MSASEPREGRIRSKHAASEGTRTVKNVEAATLPYGRGGNVSGDIDDRKQLVATNISVALQIVRD